MTVRELAQMANFGGDIQYGRKLKGDRIKAEDLLSRLTDQAQDKAQGNKKLQNIIDGAKLLSNFIPGVGPAVSAAISAVDLIGDTTRDSSFKLSKQQKDAISGSAYEDIIKQNVGALESQVKQAVKGQAKSSLLSNLLNIGLSLGGLPGVKGRDAAADVATDKIAKETVKSAAKESLPAPVGVVSENYFPIPDFKGMNPSLIKDASQRTASTSFDTATKTAAKDNNIMKFLSGKGTEESFIASLKDKPGFEALGDVIPGLNTGLSLMEKPLGKQGLTYANLYGPTSSILTRLLTEYGDATSPAMPQYQRKSIRRRIA